MGSFLSEHIGQDLNVEAVGKAGGRHFGSAIVSNVSNGFASLIQVEPNGNNGWYSAVEIPDDLPVKAGDAAIIGVDGTTRVGFVYLNGKVLRNYSAEDYERLAVEAKEREGRMAQKLLDKYREIWAARESYLSEPVRARIEALRKNSSENFDRDGWGYELTIAELTDMFVASGLVETEEIKYSDAMQDASGNQVALAKALAKMVLNGKSIENTIGGLYPLTGNPVY